MSFLNAVLMVEFSYCCNAVLIYPTLSLSLFQLPFIQLKHMIVSHYPQCIS